MRGGAPLSPPSSTCQTTPRPRPAGGVSCGQTSSFSLPYQPSFGEILGGGNLGSSPVLRAAKLRPLRTVHLPAPSSSGAQAPSPQAARCPLCIPHMAVGSPPWVPLSSSSLSTLCLPSEPLHGSSAVRKPTVVLTR